MRTPQRRSALAATFIEEFRAEMTRQGVDRYELAARLGCTPENVYQLLHSNPGLRLFTAERLAEALGLRLEIRLVAQ